MNPQNWKKAYLILLVAAATLTVVGLNAAVPTSTNPDTIQTYDNDTSVANIDYINVQGDYYWRDHNITEAIEGLSTRPVDEYGLVYGATGNWFNYTTIEDATPVYIGLQMHPDNLTVAGDYVIPNVYDKDDYHWQLELVWLGNGTQCTKDLLVMYHAHIDYDNPTGDVYIDDNAEGEQT